MALSKFPSSELPDPPAESEDLEPTPTPDGTAPVVTGPTLRVAWPASSFDPGISGVPVIGREAVAVSEADLSAVLTAARKSGVTLIKE